MKKIKILSALMLLTVSFSVCGQDTTQNISRISIHDVFVQTGFLAERSNNGSLFDFRVLAPQSHLLYNNLSGFTSPKGFNRNGNSVFSISMGLQFRDKDHEKYKANPLLRLGISYFSGNNLTASYTREDHTPYDTLTSAHTGDVYYIDSVTTQYYNMDYSSKQIRFDGSLIFRTKSDARCSLYAGVGISAGLSINTNTNISYSKMTRTETEDGSFSGNYDYSNSDITENYINHPGFGASADIPMGIDFRLGKKNEFWKQLHFFYETRPGVSIIVIPEIRTLANISAQHALGLRVSWN